VQLEILLSSYERNFESIFQQLEFIEIAKKLSRPSIRRISNCGYLKASIPIRIKMLTQFEYKSTAYSKKLGVAYL